MPHAGRLLWSVFLLTIFFFWAMLLMKRPAIKYKNRFAGPAIIVLGVGGGLTLVVLARTILKDSFGHLAYETTGWMTAYCAFVFGLWASMMAINAKQIKLPLSLSRTKFIVGGIVTMFVLYVIGAKVDTLTIPIVWLNLLIFIVLVSIVILSLPKREKDGTWAETIFGATIVFIMLTFLYAIVPHEWITFATSYLNFTKDVKVSTGGEFVLKTWMHGNWWNANTRVIPFEVNMVHLQDQTTTLIYIIGAVFNVKMFVAWQNRNQPYLTKADESETDGEEAPKKTSRFGRPVRKIKSAKVTSA